ncbi:Chemotaxis protein CheY [Candidatus Magnetomoraceae bacterium gMMP-1]
MTKILVVDDSRYSRKAMKKILETADYQVIEAENGMIALENYSLEKPDLVLLDLAMPDMFGMEVLKKLLEIDPNARVIIATGDVQSSTEPMIRAIGAVGFIPKPFKPEVVQSVIKAALTGEKE